MTPKKILFVCLGNICRSPAGQAVLESIIERENATDRFVVDSAGILDHTGWPPDARMRKAAINRGIVIRHEGRQISTLDFLESDMIIAMDDRNYSDLMQLAPSVEDSRKIRRMAEWIADPATTYIPDPYYMGPAGFELVLDLLQEACENLYKEVSL